MITMGNLNENGAKFFGIGASSSGGGGSDKVIVTISTGETGYTSDKTIDEIFEALGDRGIEALEVVFASSDDRYIPYKYQLIPTRLRVYLLDVNSHFVSGTETFALHAYFMELKKANGNAVTYNAEAVWSDGVPEES